MNLCIGCGSNIHLMQYILQTYCDYSHNSNYRHPSKPSVIHIKTAILTWNIWQLVLEQTLLMHKNYSLTFNYQFKFSIEMRYIFKPTLAEWILWWTILISETSRHYNDHCQYNGKHWVKTNTISTLAPVNLTRKVLISS